MPNLRPGAKLETKYTNVIMVETLDSPFRTDRASELVERTLLGRRGEPGGAEEGATYIEPEGPRMTPFRGPVAASSTAQTNFFHRSGPPIRNTIT
jgi:hypothetical protein